MPLPSGATDSKLPCACTGDEYPSFPSHTPSAAPRAPESFGHIGFLSSLSTYSETRTRVIVYHPVPQSKYYNRVYRVDTFAYGKNFPHFSTYMCLPLYHLLKELHAGLFSAELPGHHGKQLSGVG